MTADAGDGAAVASTVSTDVHLVVLQHGLWGNSDNLSILEAALLGYVESQEQKRVQQQKSPGSKEGHEKEVQQQQQQQHCAVRTLNSFVNHDKLTYDGVDGCGDRLVALIKDTARNLEQGQGLRVRKISFIGYSLGGLIARYAVGKLEAEGAFADKDKDNASGGGGGWEPVNFVTIATPHLGAWRMPPASLFKRAYNDLYHRMVPIISSLTGHQLMLKDVRANGLPLLLNMSDPSLIFFQGLRRFHKLQALGNTHGDDMVPYRTACICMDDKYVCKRTAPALDPLQYPSVVQPCEPGSTARPATGLPWYLLLVLLPLLLVLLPLIVFILVNGSIKGLRHYRSIPKDRAQPTWDTQRTGDRAGDSDLALAPAPGPGVLDAEQIGLRLTAENGTGASGHAAPSHAPPTSTPAPAQLPMLEMQARMVEHLNQLPWHKVDVDARHPHAHAAIVLRPKTPSQTFRKFSTRDHLDYMMTQMEW